MTSFIEVIEGMFSKGTKNTIYIIVVLSLWVICKIIDKVKERKEEKQLAADYAKKQEENKNDLP